MSSPEPAASETPTGDSPTGDSPTGESPIGDTSMSETTNSDHREEDGFESDSFESDAMRLLAYCADALRDDSGLPAFSIDRSQFNDGGTPQMLHLGRDEEGEIAWEIWNGRSAVKERIKPQSVSLYKRFRKLLMSYEMGAEIPVCTIGSGGNVGIALVTLEERPEIKSP